MRILAIPMIASRANIESESDYLVYKDLIEASPPGVFWHYWLPRKTEVKPVKGSVQLMYEDVFSDIYAQQALVTDRMFELFAHGEKHPIDAVITSRAIHASVLSRLFFSRLYAGPEMPVFVIEPKVIDYGDTHNLICQEDLALRCMGYALSYTFFSTEKEKKAALGCSRRYLSPSMVDQIDRRSTVLPLGIKCDEIDASIARSKKNEVFTVHFGGRLNSNKRWDTVVAEYDTMFAFGRNMRVQVLAPLGLAGGEVEKVCSIADVHIGLPREQYLDRMVAAHVSMNNSVEEGFTVGLVEQLYSGLVVCLPAKAWAKALLREEWARYPFIFHNQDEARVMLRYIHEHFDECLVKMEPVRALIRREYDMKSVLARMLAEVQKRVTECNAKVPVSENVAGLFRTAIASLARPVQWEALVKAIEENAFTPKPFHPRPGTMFPTKHRLYRWMSESGWTDRCTGPYPEFEEKR